MKSQKPLYPLKDKADPVGPGRPEEVETNDSAQYFQVCERAEAGEFQILGWRKGRHNAQWVFTLRWPSSQDQFDF